MRFTSTQLGGHALSPKGSASAPSPRFPPRCFPNRVVVGGYLSTSRGRKLLAPLVGSSVHASIRSNHVESLLVVISLPAAVDFSCGICHIQLCAQPWSARAAMRCPLCCMLCALPHTGTTVPPAFAPVACTQVVAYKWPSCAGGGGLGHTDRPTN